MPRSKQRKTGTAVAESEPPSVQKVPSHTTFNFLIRFCVRGKTHPILKTDTVGDEISNTCILVLHDTDDFLWNDHCCPEGGTVRRLLDGLSRRVEQGDLHAAETIFAIATEAAYALENIYERHRKLFDEIAPRRVTLACLKTVHPGTPAFLDRMLADARLGSQTTLSRQVGSKAYFVNDAPATVYARAIIESIGFNRKLDPIDKQQRDLMEYDRESGSKSVLLPFPKFIEGIERIPVPISPDNVLLYWRKGKEIILEEMPDFETRPEWEAYRMRAYKGGAKKGAIQHAIFKDILVALKTIAGTNRGSVGAAAKPAVPN